MSTKIVIEEDSLIPMKDVQVGFFCCRPSDRSYFLKTRETVIETCGLKDIVKYSCVHLEDMKIHKIKGDTLVKVVPFATISLAWLHSEQSKKSLLAEIITQLQD